MIPLKNSLGYKRSEMPQLTDHVGDKYIDKMPDFLNSLKKSGTSVTTQYEDPEDIKPTQNELNSAKLKSIVDRTLHEGRKAEGVIVSKDGYLLDGHHEWAAYKQMGRPVKTYRVGINIKPLLQNAKSFAKSVGIESRT